MNELSKVFTNNKEFNVKKLLEESPIYLDNEDSYDIFVYRRIIEAAMTLGFWNGFMPSA